MAMLTVFIPTLQNRPARSEADRVGRDSAPQGQKTKEPLRLIARVGSIFFISCLFINVALSEEIKSKNTFSKTNPAEHIKSKHIDGIEFLTGHGLAKLRSQGHYRITPLFVDLDFNLKPSLAKKGVTYYGLLQFAMEPFIAYVTEPDNNMEIGHNFLIKIGLLPEGLKFQPYLKCAAGLIYITQHTREQGSQFNFNEYAAGGFEYLFTKSIAVNLEYRYRHLSNAAIRYPNRGIGTNFTLCGISLHF